MWEFGIGLILLKLRPGSLALVAAFGLVDSSAQVLAGPFIGAYVDRHRSHIPPMTWNKAAKLSTYIHAV